MQAESHDGDETACDSSVGASDSLASAGSCPVQAVHFLEAVDAAIVVTDLSARVLYMNPQALTMHRLTAGDDRVGESYGRNFSLFDEQGRPVAADSRPITRAIAGTKVLGEVYVVRFSGEDEICLWEYSAKRVSASTPDCADTVLLTTRDVTDEVPGEVDEDGRGSERTIPPYAERLQALLDIFPVGVAICDDHGKMLEVNATMDEIWGGLPKSDGFDEFGMYRAWWAESGTPLDVSDWAMYRAVTFGETSKSELLDIARFDGGRATVLHSATPIRNERGTITGAVAVLQDVTDSMRKDRFGGQMIDVVQAILSSSNLSEKATVVCGVLDDLLDGSATVFVRVDQGGDLTCIFGEGSELAELIDEHEGHILDALRATKAVNTPVMWDDRESVLLFLPVRSAARSYGCFVTLVPHRPRLSAAELDRASQLVELLPMLFEATVAEGTDRPSSSPVPALSGPLLRLLEDQSLAYEDPEWIASRVLQFLMGEADADYGRLVVLEEEDGKSKFRVLSEDGFKRGAISAESMGVPAAAATGESVVAASGEKEDGVPFESFATLPFTMELGYGFVTLAWARRPVAFEERAVAAAPGVLFLGLLLDSAQLRTRLVQAREEIEFVGAMAEAVHSCFDTGGIQESASRIMRTHLGALDTRLFRRESTHMHEIVPTFASQTPTEYEWAKVEEVLAQAGSGCVLLTKETNPLVDLVPITAGQVAVIVPLMLRGHFIGLMVSTMSRTTSIGHHERDMIQSAAREIAVALADAEYCGIQTRIAMRSRIVESLEIQMRELTEEEEIVAASVATAFSSLKADGAAYVVSVNSRPKITFSEGSTDAKQIRDGVAVAVRGMSSAATVLVDDGAVIVSTAWLDEEPCALVVLRDGTSDPFSHEDLELLHRIHAAFSHAVRELRLASERESMLVAREQWLADVSHDLKTPLSVIRGYAELLASTADVEPEDIRHQAERIGRHATEIERVLATLQLVFRLRAKALPVVLATHDLNSVAAEVVGLVQADSRTGIVDIALEPLSGEVLVAVDKPLLVRALSNVTMNAVVHGGPDVQVRVRVVRTTDGLCRVEVEDDGRGIESAELDRVFSRYYSGSAARGDGASTGLGLPIARELVELMGGELEVDSEPGRGTTVGISLPRACAEPDT